MTEEIILKILFCSFLFSPGDKNKHITRKNNVYTYLHGIQPESTTYTHTYIDTHTFLKQQQHE